VHGQAPVTGSDMACPAGRISYVFIDNHSVFDTSDDTPSSVIRWAYGAANAMHVRTRVGFIRNELLFEVGDCLDPFLLSESGRILRQYRFLASADVFAVPQPDGTVHVVVDTWDEWTTKLDLGVAISDGIEIRRVGLTEENFLGRGMLVGFFFRERREQQEKGIEFESPRLFSTRWDARLSAGRTRVGDFVVQELQYPFLGEVGQSAARQQLAFRENLFAYATPSSPDYDNVLLPFTERRAELTLARRCCEPGRFTMFGLGLTFEGLTYPGYPENVEVTPEGDFDQTEPADSVAIEAVSGQVVPRETTRINILMGRRHVGFSRRESLDAITGIQDVAHGWEVVGTVGLGVPLLSDNVAEAPDDLFTALRLFGGAAPGNWVVNSTASIEGRFLFEQGAGGSGWRDLIAEFDVYTYWRPSVEGTHTLFARVVAAAGWSMAMPFQLTLGGEDMLRGYRDEFFPGGQRLVVNVEDRMRFHTPLDRLMDLGATVFADAGVAWAGDVPFGEDSGLQGNVGVGLRVGFPTGTRQVLRFDFAWPMGQDAAFDNVVFRITGFELLGLLNGLEDRQLQRSRRSGVAAGLFDSPVR